ncbi:MAG: sugar transporter [Lautropia sp.]|nr:sugar transporter [Lautropia sp.]
MPASDLSRWLSVLALALSGFVFNTSEFIPIALLSDIGRDFGMQATQTGVMITVYAWVVALLSLPLMLLTQRMERRSLLLVLFAVFVGAHVMSYYATSFAMLMVSRVLVALTHAVFWSITAALVVRVAPEGRGHKALSLLCMGAVMATVLGLPLGRLVGGLFGWRLSLLLIGMLALLTALVLARNLPRLPSVNSGNLSSLPVLLRRRSLMLMYAFTVLMITAHFTAYSYIEPFVRQVAGLSGGDVTTLLMLYGAAGFLGSWCFGKWFSQHGRTFYLSACALMMCSLLLLQAVSGSVWSLYALCMLWGTTYAAVGLVMQSEVLRLASDATDVATSIYSGLYNVGIGGGALLGHFAAGHLHLSGIGFVAGGLAAGGLLLACQMVRQPVFSGKRSAPSDAAVPALDERVATTG